MAIARISFSVKSLNFFSIVLCPQIQTSTKNRTNRAAKSSFASICNLVTLFAGFRGVPGLLSPIVEEGDASKDDCQAQRRAHRPDHPQVDSQSHGGSQKDQRGPRMAPGAVRTRQVGFASSQTKEGNRSQREENPPGKNKQRIELFVSAAECEQRSDRAEEDQCAAGSAKRRVNALGEAKENAVASHGERDASARQDRDVESSESGDGHTYRQPDCAARTRERLHYVGSDVLRLRQRREWQSTEVNDIRQQVQTAHSDQSQDDGSRNVLLGAENLFAQIAEVVETVVGPHGGNQRGQQSADRSQTERRGDRGPRFHCIVLAEHHARYDNH